MPRLPLFSATSSNIFFADFSTAVTSTAESSLQIKKKISATIHIYTKHDGSEEGYFGRDWIAKREGSCQTHLAGECLGKQSDPRHRRRRLLRWTPRANKSTTLEGLPVFVDDFYVYGPLRKDQIVRVRGRQASCTTGKEGSVKRLISQISLFV